MGVILSLMDWFQSLIVKYLGNVISVYIIRDIEDSYIVPKNPMPLGVGVSVILLHPLIENRGFIPLFFVLI
jgi:hypothetical protein